MEINEIKNDKINSLEIYYPTYDVNRSMACGYTGLKISIPQEIDISLFEDSFIKDLSEKFYSLNLFKPEKDNGNELKQVEQLSIFAKELLADKINQFNK
jgi:hypothetical protein